MKIKHAFTMFATFAFSVVAFTGCSKPNDDNSGTDDPVVHTHTLSDWVCSETEHWKTCSECNEVVDKATHTGGTAACTKKAICTVCGHEYGTLADHEYSAWISEGEEKHSRQCSDCGDKQVEDHTWNDGKITFSPTHTAEGTKVYTCTKCHNTKSVTLDKITSHTYDQEVEDEKYLFEEGDCTHGSKYYKSCVCGEFEANPDNVFTSTHFGHDYSELISETLGENGKPINFISEANCEQAAKYFKVCSKCGEMTNEEFTYGTALGHDVIHVASVAASYASGCDEHYECTRCGKYFDKEGDDKQEIEPTSVNHFQKDDMTFENSETNPYLIKNIKDLKTLRDDVNSATNENKLVFENTYFKLANDITFELEEDSEHGVDFGTCIGLDDNHKFAGIFDGDNHTISNLTIDASTLEKGGDSRALFSRLNGTVKNLNFANAYIVGKTQRAAVLAARAENATIENVNVLSGSVSGVQQNAGIVGIVVNSATIKNCTNKAMVTGSDSNNGGIVSYLHSGNLTIQGCVNEGLVTSKAFTGGILGRAIAGTVTIIGCENDGKIVGTNVVDSTGATLFGTGGIVGNLWSTAVCEIRGNTVNKGEVNAEGGTGGIIGSLVGGGKATAFTKVTIEDTTNEGVINAKGEGVGGIVGRLAKAYDQLYATNITNKGDVNNTSTNYGIAGLVGINVDNAYFEVKDSLNLGNVTSAGQYVGGLCGLIRKGRVPGATAASACNTFENCTQKGNVQGSNPNNAGSLAGINRGILKNCKVLDTITVNGAVVGTLTNVFYGGQDNGGTNTGCELISE